VIARELLAHGPTAQVLTAENLFRARQMCEAFDDDAAVCLPESRGAA
jgi:zinc/manganese transport system ATP-binding protein